MNFCPRTIVNGATMRLNSGKPVSIAVKVENYGGGSMVMQGIATDDARITINLRAPLDKNITNQWIEVIGTSTRPDAINASEVIVLPEGGEELDKKSHNMMIQFLTNAPNVLTIR